MYLNKIKNKTILVSVVTTQCWEVSFIILLHTYNSQRDSYLVTIKTSDTFNLMSFLTPVTFNLSNPEGNQDLLTSIFNILLDLHISFLRRIEMNEAFVFFHIHIFIFIYSYRVWIFFQSFLNVFVDKNNSF